MTLKYYPLRMRHRHLFFILKAILILGLFIGVSFWNPQNVYSLSKMESEKFTLPITAKLVPIKSDLSFHWKVNPNSLPKYLENSTSKSNKKATR